MFGELLNGDVAIYDSKNLLLFYVYIIIKKK